MRVGLPALVLLLFSPWATAQYNCPQGFRYAGTLSGTGSVSTPFDKRMAVRFPENTSLDASFQQKKVHATNGKSGASSSLRPEDIPKGVLIITYGKEDKITDAGWAVSAPELKGIARDDTGRITRYEFGMKLFCTVHSGGTNPMVGECSVNVEVCYKPSR